MLDPADYDDVIVTVAHPWGSSARRRDGSPVPLEEIPHAVIFAEQVEPDAPGDRVRVRAEHRVGPWPRGQLQPRWQHRCLLLLPIMTSWSPVRCSHSCAESR